MEKLFILIVLLLIIVFVVLPVLKALFAPSQDGAPLQKGEKPLSKREVDALVKELEESLFSRKPTLTDQEKINRLAKSDPEKAKELVRRWLQE